MSETNSHRRDHLDTAAVAILVAMCALWGLQSVAIRAAITDGMPPVLSGAARAAGATLLTIGWTRLRHGRDAFRALWRYDAALIPGLWLGVIFAAEFVALYLGLGMTTASRGVLFLYTAPFFTALGAHLFLPQERIGAWQAAGLLLAFGGVAIAFEESLAAAGGSIAGDALALLAAALWGASNVVIKGSPGLREVNAERLLVYQLGFSVPLMLIAGLALGEDPTMAGASAMAWLALGYQTVIVAFASYLVWFWMMLVYPVAPLSGFTFLTPIFGVAFGGMLLGETLSLGVLAGLVAIVLGLRLVNRRRPRVVAA